MQAFLADYTAKFAEYEKKHGARTLKLAAATNLKQTRDRFGGLAAAELARAMESKAEKIRLELDAMIAEYESRREERNQAAFRALDTNNDGLLQLKEVVDALTPDHPASVSFHSALGFPTEAQHRERCAQQ